MDKISVIMPVYNTAEYLPKAIQSVLQQSYDNWELIIVDDGSTDDSYEICREFAAMDKRIKVWHQDNSGQGIARNLALEHCTGDYVMFLDSDDWIDDDCMDFLLANIHKYDADVVECGCRSVSSNGEVDEYLHKDTLCMDAHECIKHLGKDDAVGPGACSKLFTRQILIGMKFPPLRAYEDYLFIYQLCADVTKYVHIYEPKWNYLHRENSTMTSSFSLRRLALVEAQKGICSLLKERGFTEEFLQAQKILCSKQFYILHCLWSNAAIEGAPEAAKKLQEEILQSYDDYMANPLMGQNKLMLRIFRYLPKSISLILFRLKFRVK